ncbi:zonular occludens toxin [Stenotrophomonas maltophilia]|uniref:zonular occludens toxin domain-containing protein n=1 Tax=Stenotrophomonas maltophilia TaxID=40324 RepID=UPI0021C8C494|nr:zonular occludens toxin domain-containing protein [Stenotrophomonas maltophilia]MCU1091309.1 zonular occludens toxin [Stenotrophomonas maltophilia]
MSIYKTAAMSILTGILGSGKTLRAVQLMMGAINDGEKVYQSGFKGLQVPGVIDWEDPRKWQELPAGAILFVDEAQKWFGERRSGYAPDYLKAMNTMRGEEGVRMVLLTQHPKYLDSHIKDLVGCHEHLLRESGKLSSKLYRSDEIMEDPRSPRGRAKADFETFRFPIETAGKMYVSSNSPHTIKYRMPAVVKKAILIGGLGAASLLGVWYFMFRSAYADIADKGEQGAGAAAGAPTAGRSGGSEPASSSSGGRVAMRTGTDYIAAITPMVQDVPWSAPAYMDRPVVSDPHLYCMSTDNSCRCVTDQGTKPIVAVRDDVCREIARWGEPYNPFKAPVKGRDEPRRLDASNDTEQASRSAGTRVEGGIAARGSTIDHVERLSGSFPEVAPFPSSSAMTTAAQPNKM